MYLEHFKEVNVFYLLWKICKCVIDYFTVNQAESNHLELLGCGRKDNQWTCRLYMGCCTGNTAYCLVTFTLFFIQIIEQNILIGKEVCFLCGKKSDPLEEAQVSTVKPQDSRWHLQLELFRAMIIVFCHTHVLVHKC